MLLRNHETGLTLLATTGTALLVVEGGSTAHLWTTAHDSRSAHRLLYLAAVRYHEREQADWGRIIGLTSGGDLGFPEESLLRRAAAASMGGHCPS